MKGWSGRDDKRNFNQSRHKSFRRAESRSAPGEKQDNLASPKQSDTHSDEVLPFLQPLMNSGVKKSIKFIIK